MSDYGQVIMGHSGACMWQKWGPEELPKTVQRVLATGLNWDNEDGLARRIFEAMSQGYGKYEGFGLSGEPMIHTDVDIIINTEYKTVTIGDVTCTFEEYIESDLAFLEVEQ